jgi:predicted secreted Zn-dependent protease
MKLSQRLLLPVVILASSAAVARAEWQAVEVVKNYAVKGKTGPELYMSIGERGPTIGGKVRAIAYTNFSLTWSRKYEPKDGICTLTSAVPKLTITYTLPKPAEKLPEPIRKNWETFFTGIHDHEKVHGDLIKQMVKEIEAATIGMSVADDPGCVKIKTELKKRLIEVYKIYKQRNRDFEQKEMSDGGNVHRLILGLVNGG